MRVEALPGFEDFINYNNVQEQPDPGSVFRPPSVRKEAITITEPEPILLLPGKLEHNSRVSLTLSRSRNRGLRYRVRGVRRGRLGCRCVMRGIGHQCGERTGTIINSPKLIYHQFHQDLNRI